MAETTDISWADCTLNPWIGCTKVGPGCDFCYAERENVRRKWTPGWGPGEPRYHTSPQNWNKARTWNKDPSKIIGDAWPARKPRVFCASLADVFDNEVPAAWRDELWKLIRETPNLQWLIVTKRIGNAAKMLPADWGDGYQNVVLIATVVNQDEADRDIDKLVATPARKRGLSIEPMLGRIDLTRWMGRMDWIIVGGESGAEARPMEKAWALEIASLCRWSDVPFHFKQVGSNHAGWDGITGKGKDTAEWPYPLRVQEFPPPV